MQVCHEVYTCYLPVSFCQTVLNLSLFCHWQSIRNMVHLRCTHRWLNMLSSRLLSIMVGIVRQTQQHWLSLTLSSPPTRLYEQTTGRQKQMGSLGKTHLPCFHQALFGTSTATLHICCSQCVVYHHSHLHSTACGGSAFAGPCKIGLQGALLCFHCLVCVCIYLHSICRTKQGKRRCPNEH